MSNHNKRVWSESLSAVANVIKTMVRGVVDNEDRVDVTYVAGRACVVFEVVVDDSDMGFALGQNGRTVEAMRTIINGMCKKLEIKYTFTIISYSQVHGEGSS